MAQWIVDRDNRQIAAVREIYNGKNVTPFFALPLIMKSFPASCNIIERIPAHSVDKQKMWFITGKSGCQHISAQKVPKKCWTGSGRNILMSAPAARNEMDLLFL